MSAAILCGVLYLYVRANAPTPPIADYTPNPVAAQQFENKIDQAAVIARQTQQFTVALTEAEVSSWLNLNAPSVLDSDIPLRNLQARFRDGQTSLYAEVDPGLGFVGMEVGVQYTILPDGRVEVALGEVDFGGLGLPSSFKDELSSQIQTTIDRELNEISGSYQISQITSSDGILRISGTVNN